MGFHVEKIRGKKFDYISNRRKINGIDEHLLSIKSKKRIEKTVARRNVYRILDP